MNVSSTAINASVTIAAAIDCVRNQTNLAAIPIATVPASRETNRKESSLVPKPWTTDHAKPKNSGAWLPCADRVSICSNEPPTVQPVCNSSSHSNSPDVITQRIQQPVANTNAMPNQPTTFHLATDGVAASSDLRTVVAVVKSFWFSFKSGFAN